MTEEADLTQPQEDGRQAIASAIQDSEPVLGPGKLEDSDQLDEPPNGPCLLSEWVLVMNWVDEDGKSFITKLTSEGLLDHHSNGLLWTALNEM